jgi:hypothetical protein
MADNFNLRAFLTENKLTKNAKLLNENQEDYKYFDEEGIGGFYLTTIDGVKIYSLEDSSIMDTCSYALEDEDGYIDFISIDVSGEPISSEELQNEYELQSDIADFIEADIARELGQEGEGEMEEGTETSWKDLWNALQAALDKKDDEESTAALKVIGRAVSSKLKGHAKQGADALKAHLEK